MFIAPDDEEGLRAIERHLSGERGGPTRMKAPSPQSRPKGQGSGGGRGQQGPRRDDNRRGSGAGSNSNRPPFARDGSSNGNAPRRGEGGNQGRRWHRRPGPRDA
jgi:hypothetical protein